MVGVSSALAGNRVYNFGSNVPNRGQVNAQGYLQRELKKQGQIQQPRPPQAPRPPQGNIGQYGGVSTFGQDNQSDTRSGVAQSMLQNQQGTDQQDPLEYDSPVKATGKKINPSKALTETQGAKPVVKVTSVGKLKMPYNFKYASAALKEKQKAQEALAKANREWEEGKLELGQQRYEADTQYEQLAQDTLNQHAAAGTAFSSGYGTSVRSNVTDYNSILSQILGERGLLDSTYLENVGNIQTGLQDYLRQAAVAQAEEEGRKASSTDLTKRIKRAKKK